MVRSALVHCLFLQKKQKLKHAPQKISKRKVFIKKNDDNMDHLEARPRAKTMTHYNHVFLETILISQRDGLLAKRRV